MRHEREVEERVTGRAFAADEEDRRHRASSAQSRRHPCWWRAREIAADLQRTLVEELEREPTVEDDATLLAAFFIACYTTVMVETARRLIAGDPFSAVVDDHRARFERLFDALRHGVVRHP